MEQRKIATHNSATGEKGKGLLSWLLIPFSRCQNKTIRQQYEAGCRHFDIRVRPDRHGVWRCAHGPWMSRKTVGQILTELNYMAGYADTWVMITYEGECPYEPGFLSQVDEWMHHTAPRLLFSAICAKKPRWHTLSADHDAPPADNAFVMLDGSSWHTLLPIPWLWAVLKQKKTFNETRFTIVDFL